MAMIEVAYIYCGGCNSRYDRVAMIRRLADECPWISLVHADRLGAPPAGMLVICGCSTGCVCNLKNSNIPLFCLTDPSDYPEAKAFLERMRDKDNSSPTHL